MVKVVNPDSGHALDKGGYSECRTVAAGASFQVSGKVSEVKTFIENAPEFK